MMKKKTHDQEESRNKNNNKPTDNKEHTDLPEIPEGSLGNDEISGQSTDAAPVESQGKDDSADKVVPEVRAALEKLAEMQDKYLRLSAEFDNYRKRTLREKMELSKYAEESILLKIIPLMDDFERALAHTDTSADGGAMKNGIELIYLKFSEFLKQSGVKEIEALNSDFNVDLHEAVAKVPVEENEKKGKVVDVVLKGYYLQDKVLRFAKVVVGE
jgi:molecular chaperone GrpE